VVLPDDDDEAIRRLRELTDHPGQPASLSADQLSWSARLDDIAGAVR
jgi:hypothetical protein